MTKRVRIGSRESELALHQAEVVQSIMLAKGLTPEIVPISSDGDLDLVTPLYEMGIQGIFTKSLDAALLENKIDIAVHSAKDIPTKLAQGLIIGAILERADVTDSLVFRPGTSSIDSSIDLESPCRIATGSIRRRMQWLSRYANHTLDNVRGNIQTRLVKLEQSDWDGVIIASAALQRLQISDAYPVTKLDWMLPAPAQGAIAVVCREDDETMKEACGFLNHALSHQCVAMERDFMSALQGGCSVPIAALAQEEDNGFRFRGLVSSINSRNKCEVNMLFRKDQLKEAGEKAAAELVQKGAGPILAEFKNKA